MKIIKRIKPETANVVFVDKDGTKHDLGEVNEYEFNQLRIEIMREGLEGYRVIPSGDSREYIINSNGRVVDWPDNLFSVIENQLRTLLTQDGKKSEIS